ncbi:MAG: hypothetical protein ACYCTE_09505 [Acidimicrobiales bacterium]
METALPRFSPEDVERFIEAVKADDALRARVEQAILSGRLLHLPDAVDDGFRRLEDAIATLTEAVNSRFSTLEDAVAETNRNVTVLAGSVSALVDAVNSRFATLEDAVAETNRNVNWVIQDGFPRMLDILGKIGDDVAQVKGDVAQVKDGVEQVKDDVEQVKGDVMAVKVDVALLNDRMSAVERHLGLAS